MQIDSHVITHKVEGILPLSNTQIGGHTHSHTPANRAEGTLPQLIKTQGGGQTHSHFLTHKVESLPSTLFVRE